MPGKRRNSLPLSARKIPSHTTYDDAAELARYDCPFPPGANEYNAFIQRRMA